MTPQWWGDGVVLSSVVAQFDPTQCVETLEIGRTYPKRAVVSYLMGQPICACFRDDEGKSLVECQELKILVDHFGLLPLGPPQSIRFLGQHVIDAEIRRNTDSWMEPTYRRVSTKRLTVVKGKSKNESLDSSEEGGH